MRWHYKIEPLDPATVTAEEMAAVHRRMQLGQRMGVVLGIIAAANIYAIWKELGQDKWVEYTLLPAIVIGGCLVYRITYEFVIRFRS